MIVQPFLLPLLTFAFAFMVCWVRCRATVLSSATAYLVKYDAVDSDFKVLVSHYFGSQLFYSTTIGLLAAGLSCVVAAR